MPLVIGGIVSHCGSCINHVDRDARVDGNHPKTPSRAAQAEKRSILSHFGARCHGANRQVAATRCSICGDPEDLVTAEQWESRIP